MDTRRDARPSSSAGSPRLASRDLGNVTRGVETLDRGGRQGRIDLKRPARMLIVFSVSGAAASQWEGVLSPFPASSTSSRRRAPAKKKRRARDALLCACSLGWSLPGFFLSFSVASLADTLSPPHLSPFDEQAGWETRLRYGVAVVSDVLGIDATDLHRYPER